MAQQLAGAKLIDTETIKTRIKELGREITTAYIGRRLILIGVLNGAFIFTADLCRAIDLDLEIDFIRVSSYGVSTESSGSIQLVQTPRLDLTGKDLLLVEDIVDTGVTMAWLKKYFLNSSAASVKICAFIDRKERRTTSVEVDYIGFALDYGFLVGYGLDCGEHYRQLPAVYALEE